MTHAPTPELEPYFTALGVDPSDSRVPKQFAFVIDHQPHALCAMAAEHLQSYLETQTDWQHNFGLEPNEAGTIIGKMFGILVVQNKQHEIGYLAAFSGKLAGSNIHSRFVPPVFDTLTHNSFLNLGMAKLNAMNNEVKALTDTNLPQHQARIEELKDARKKHSSALQFEIYEHYHFLNRRGEIKSLNTLFAEAQYKNPPSGAGECAGPKLLQYAFQHDYKPLAIAEFWWGLSPKSDQWQHGHYYPCCREKCGPILVHMLEGM